MLADHLASGDYAVTCVVFAVLVVAAAGTLVASLTLARERTRVLGLSIMAVLSFAAVRVILRWDEMTEAADHVTGPAGDEFRWSELDLLVRTAFGDVASLLLIALVVSLVVGAREADVGHEQIHGHLGSIGATAVVNRSPTPDRIVTAFASEHELPIESLGTTASLDERQRSRACAVGGHTIRCMHPPRPWRIEASRNRGAAPG